MSKLISIEDADAHVKDGMTLMIGGFLGAGTGVKMVEAIANKGVKDLTLICNDTAYPNKAIGMLISNKQVKKLYASHIGTNADTIQQLNEKTLEIEFCPQGTLAERIRCGGAGLGGKRKIEVDGKEYLLELPLHADVAIIGASICDEMGNAIYKGTTQNFNPMMAAAADLVILETKELVPTGSIPMEQIHTPGIYIDYIVK